MKKDVRLLDTFIYTLFFVSTAITLFIVYRDIPSNFAFDFVVFYAFLVMVIPFYIVTRVVFTVKHFDKFDKKSTIISFIKQFILIMIGEFIINLILPIHSINMVKAIPTTLAFTFGIVCFEILFLKKAN